MKADAEVQRRAVKQCEVYFFAAIPRMTLNSPACDIIVIIGV
jgi:hypothetical protein